MQLTLLRDALLGVAQPYSHLYHADGTLYMERWIIVPRRKPDGCHVRLHHICTEDQDRHLHDHPFSFGSLVLTGGYIEARPVTRSPCFLGADLETLDLLPFPYEEVRQELRKAGSFAYRHACDRHRIVWVQENTWTLVFAGPLRQWWGFYTEKGKIHWRDYESEHTTYARTEK